MAKLTAKQKREKMKAVAPYVPPLGRPKKLNENIQQVIIETLLQGNTRGCAAARAGISYSTFNNWMQRGEAIEDQPNPTDEDKEYFAFFDLVNRAEAEAHAQSVKNVVGQGKKNFQAAAWWLERRFDKDWNKTDRVEHAGEVVHKHEINLSALTDEELIAYRNAVAKAQGKLIEATATEVGA